MLAGCTWSDVYATSTLFFLEFVVGDRYRFVEDLLPVVSPLFIVLEVSRTQEPSKPTWLWGSLLRLKPLFWRKESCISATFPIQQRQSLRAADSSMRWFILLAGGSREAQKDSANNIRSCLVGFFFFLFPFFFLTFLAGGWPIWHFLILSFWKIQALWKV